MSEKETIVKENNQDVNDHIVQNNSDENSKDDIENIKALVEQSKNELRDQQNYYQELRRRAHQLDSTIEMLRRQSSNDDNKKNDHVEANVGNNSASESGFISNDNSTVTNRDSIEFQNSPKQRKGEEVEELKEELKQEKSSTSWKHNTALFPNVGNLVQKENSDALIGGDEKILKETDCSKIEGNSTQDETLGENHNEESDDDRSDDGYGEYVGEGEDMGITEIKGSLCMACGKTGVTKMLLTNIPFFREVILMSFYCPHCKEKNAHIQSAGEIQEKGCRITCTLQNLSDLSRQVVKSETATMEFKEIELEIPAEKGSLSTVEGHLREASDSLAFTQPVRRHMDPESADKIDEYIIKLNEVIRGDHFPLTLIIDDPAGNSFLENLNAPAKDPQMKIRYYVRNAEQNESLGLQSHTNSTSEENEDTAIDENGNGDGDGDGHGSKEYGSISVSKEKNSSDANIIELNDSPHENSLTGSSVKLTTTNTSFKAPEGAKIQLGGRVTDADTIEKEVLLIPSNCQDCGKLGDSKMYVTDIPFFKEVIIMAFNCDYCGFKSNEIKGGGEIPDTGELLALKVPPASDDKYLFESLLARDVIKSNTSGVEIPELELEITQGSLGGMYTSVEGLMNVIKENLFGGVASEFVKGDSAQSSRTQRFAELEDKFDACMRGEIGFTLMIIDPMANSFIYNPYAPDADPLLRIEPYQRTVEDDEFLGLLDMNVDHYDEKAILESENLKKQQKEQSATVDTNDSSDDFEPCETFQGDREGWVFKQGPKGFGYYADQSSQSKSSYAEARMKALQVGGSLTHPTLPNVLKND